MEVSPHCAWGQILDHLWQFQGGFDRFVFGISIYCWTVFSPSNVSACCWLSVLSMFWPLDLGIEYNMLSMVVLKGQRILNGMSIFSELVSNCHNLFVSWRKSNHNWIVMFELTLCRNLDVFQHVHDDIWRHVLLHGLPCCGCCHWYFMLLLVVSHLVTGGFPGCPLSKHETCALEGCGRELSQKLYIFNDSDLHKLGQATGQGTNGNKLGHVMVFYSGLQHPNRSVCWPTGPCFEVSLFPTGNMPKVVGSWSCMHKHMRT